MSSAGRVGYDFDAAAASIGAGGVCCWLSVGGTVGRCLVAVRWRLVGAVGTTRPTETAGESGEAERSRRVEERPSRKIVREIRSDYPDADISVDTPTECRLPVMRSVEAAIRELVENAAAHAGEDPDEPTAASRTRNLHNQ